MYKSLLFLLLCLLPFVHQAAEGDTTWVQAHTSVDMTWYGAYDAWAEFPNDPTKTYTKVIMYYTLGCASSGCSGWDYDVEIRAMIPTGTYDSNVASIDTLTMDTTWNVFEVQEHYEMGRLVTPYGTYMRDGTNGFDNSWTHPYVYEVTDFVNLLQDSVLIRSFYSGWSSGFSADVRFAFIEGTPPRDVLGIENVYSGSGGYVNSGDWEVNHWPAASVSMGADAKNSRARVTISGHGFDNSASCAEFCPRDFSLYVDSDFEALETIWKGDCGHNPVYPQGGTWIYDRADWCPGSKVIQRSYDLSDKLMPGSSHVIDMNMQAYSWSGTQTPSYKYEVQLVSYGDPNFNHDAELLEIVAPSQHADYTRMNPICDHPIISFRNTGGEPLGTVLIEYGVVGGTPCYYRWWASGDPLGIMEEETITLPLFDWTGFNSTNPEFYAKVSEPNLMADEYALNDMQTSSFDVVPQLESQLILWLRTNNVAADNGYEVIDENGTVLYSRAPGTMTAATQYKDTFNLDEGCYTLRVTDATGDGLAWWANAAAGNGSCRLRRGSTGGLLKSFTADFGSEIYYQFTVGYPQGSDPTVDVDCSPRTGIDNVLEDDSRLNIFPNPGSGLYSIEFDALGSGSYRMLIMDSSGKTIRSEQVEVNSFFSTQIELTDEPDGIYFFVLENDKERFSRPLVKTN